MLAPAGRSFSRALGNLLIVSGLALVLFTGGQYLHGLYQLSQWGALAPSPALPSLEPPPVFQATGSVDPHRSPAGAPATHIRIPSIDVDSRVVELGTVLNEQGELVWETAKHAVGHHTGTAHPGEPGNVVMSGHIRSPIKKEGNVFNRLPDLKVGQVVFVETADGTHEYRVVSRRVVEPSEVSVMSPTERPVLTLITCFPDWIYSHRLIVIAEPAGFTPAGT